MRKTANTILCYGIAVILLFFGMSFDEAEVYFRTQNTRAESVTAIVCQGGATISEVESFSTQLVGTRSESVVQQLVNQSSQSKKDAKAFCYILLVSNLSDNYSNSDKVTDEIESTDIYHRVAVLNYIHDLDGKKRV